MSEILDDDLPFEELEYILSTEPIFVLLAYRSLFIKKEKGLVRSTIDITNTSFDPSRAETKTNFDKVCSKVLAIAEQAMTDEADELMEQAIEEHENEGSNLYKKLIRNERS